MSERPRPSHDDEQHPNAVGPTKIYDDVYRFRGYHDREPRGICRVRLFDRG